MNISTILISKLAGRVPEEYLPAISIELDMLLADYDIAPKCTELVVHDGLDIQILGYYMASLRVDGKQPKTIEHYAEVLRRFLVSAGKPIKDITAVDVRKYLYDLRQAGTGARTAENYRCAISGFLHFCKVEGYIAENPCDKIHKIKFNPNPTEPLSDEEMDAIRQGCRDDKRLTALVEVLYGTGLRVSEAIGLKKTDIDWDHGTVTVIKKGGAVHTPPISDTAMLAILDYLETRTEDGEYVFTSARSKGRPVSRTIVERWLKDLGEQVGIPGLHPHRFRHTTATKCRRGGMPLEEVSMMLGHASISTTLIYAKRDPESLKQHHANIL